VEKKEAQSETLVSKLGEFAYSCFLSENLLDIADLVINGEALTLTQLDNLANTVPLPLLAKLAEVVSKQTEPKELTTTVRPVAFLPLASLLEQGGKEIAIETGKRYLSKLNSSLSLEASLTLAIDRWTGEFAIDELLSVLYQLTASNKYYSNVLPLGPSTTELKLLLTDARESKSTRLEDVFTILRDYGVTSIEGGSDFDLHLLAADKGFSLSIGHNLTNSSSASSAKNFVNGSQFKHNKFSTEFLDQLFFIRQTLVPTGLVEVWFPWSSCKLDNGAADEGKEPLGEQFVRAIMLGRLILPRVKYIRAPLSLLGLKVAQLALAFGANDLGFAAVDSNTANSLGIARISEIPQDLNKNRAFSQVVV
jgi:hypothetical protein